MERLVNASASELMDFAAKVRWRIEHDRNPLLVTLQDKYAVRAYVEARGVATARLLWHSNRPGGIPFRRLGDRFIIKAAHGCGWNLIGWHGGLYRFGNGEGLLHPDGSLNLAAPALYRLDREMWQRQCDYWLSIRHNKGEWAYQHIPPRIVIEEWLRARDSCDLKDYRCYVFDGRVAAINVGSPRLRERGENIFFDPDWNPIELTRYAEAVPDPLPTRPADLAGLLRAAEALGRGIDFVRVDLYETDRGIVAGELTVYPQAGLPNTPTACPKFNAWLGAQWKLPEPPPAR